MVFYFSSIELQKDENHSFVEICKSKPVTEDLKVYFSHLLFNDDLRVCLAKQRNSKAHIASPSWTCFSASSFDLNK